MKNRIHAFGFTALLALALGAAAQTNPTIPPSRPAPGAETPPPGTQDDRQIPEGGRNRVDQPTNRNQTTSRAATPTEISFPQKAAMADMTEVQFGQLARQKGSTDQVRDFGKMLADEHNDHYRKVKGMAEKENIAIGTEVDPSKQATYQKLSGLSGAEFDRAFAAEMVNDHREAIAEYEKEANGGDSETWRDFAKDTLPTLNKHLEAAQNISNANPSTNTNPTSTTRPLPNPESGVPDSTYGRPTPNNPQTR